jgi:hypothetical protein
MSSECYWKYNTESPFCCKSLFSAIHVLPYLETLIWRNRTPELLTYKSSTPIMSIPISNPSQRKMYHVRSFFTALHIILTSILPPDRELREYIHIFVLVTLLLGRLLRHYKSLCGNIKFAKKISLLVVLPSPYQRDQQFCSRACIGFTATGPAETKKCLRNKIIHDRIQNLPELARLTTKKNFSSPGNCAEAETFGHLDTFVSSIRQISTKSRFTLCVTSTLSLLDGTPDQSCPQCLEMLRLLRKKDRFLRTFDLAPVKVEVEIESGNSNQII